MARIVASPPRRRTRTAGSRAVAMVLPLVAAACGLAALVRRPLVLWNATPSEPEGLYLAWPGLPKVGDLIAFHAPSVAFPYADAHLSYLHETPLLKAVAASAGDRVCALDGALQIQHRQVGAITARDGRGVQLPHWAQCRRLSRDEVFVFSNRVQNSFDSRYFGPVSTEQILGVYRPLRMASGGA